ncbi:hypothetical protein T4C_5178 [Trichinella pseudospiralis]|uniref:Uncharacterized protein n=1 Tax=Trichinella pseudospiralis TaxID=6337 RepID=A0A0V1JLH9_TRIPS|nr:hypothetical protein T4C_5178 [Trichinella pseudospiralis]
MDEWTGGKSESLNSRQALVLMSNKEAFGYVNEEISERKCGQIGN